MLSQDEKPQNVYMTFLVLNLVFVATLFLFFLWCTAFVYCILYSFLLWPTFTIWARFWCLLSRHLGFWRLFDLWPLVDLSFGNRFLVFRWLRFLWFSVVDLWTLTLRVFLLVSLQGLLDDFPDAKKENKNLVDELNGNGDDINNLF